MRVAEPAIAAAGQHHAIAHIGEIGNQRLAVLVEDLRADRDLEDDIGAVGSGAILAHAVLAALCLEMLLVAIVDQRVEAIDTDDDHVAAAPAITTVRAPELDELLAAERHAAIAAIARADEDLRLVEEFHRDR